jgi:hypothetical protein
MTPIEIVDNLKTTLVPADGLASNNYVLLPEDADNPDVSLYVSPDYPAPVVWRVDGWYVPDGETEQVLRLDAPEERLEVFVDDDTPPIRLILPGQNHETWEPQQ